MSHTSIFDRFKLDQRVAIVTGGAGLLGKEFCRTLAEAGAGVVVADLDETAAQRVAESLQDEGWQAVSVKVDVTAPDSVRAMVAQTLSIYNRLDILVNSAALDPKFDPQHGGHSNTFEDYPIELWNQALAVNLTGVFLCCQAVIPSMLRQGKGVIINLASIYALTAPDRKSVV